MLLWLNDTIMCYDWMELVGNTPLLKISRYCEAVGAAESNVIAKLEYLNPAGSAKDRVGLEMIED